MAHRFSFRSGLLSVAFAVVVAGAFAGPCAARANAATEAPPGTSASPTGLLAAVTLQSGTPAAATLQSATRAEPWTPDIPAARAFANSRTGQVSFRVLDQTSGRRWGYDGARQVHGASLLKTLLMATYLRQAGVRNRALNAHDRALLAPMIRRSANEPAGELVVRLGSTAINQAARAAGMGSVRISAPWGHTLTSSRAQVRLFASLPKLLPPRHRDYAMHLLRTITPSQRWGVGQVELPSWRVYFKGGWGSGSGAVDHQTALLIKGDRRIVLSITTTANASHADGRATLRGVAVRLLRGLASSG